MCGKQDVEGEAEGSVRLSKKTQEKGFLVKMRSFLSAPFPLPPSLHLSPTSRYLGERDTALSNLIHLNHKSLHGDTVLKAKNGPQ